MALGFLKFFIWDFFGIFKSQSRSPEFRDFGIFLEFFKGFKSPSRSPGFRDFRYFSIQPKFKNPDPEFLGSRFGIPKKSQPEANSDDKELLFLSEELFSSSFSDIQRSDLLSFFISSSNFDRCPAECRCQGYHSAIVLRLGSQAKLFKK